MSVLKLKRKSKKLKLGLKKSKNAKGDEGLTQKQMFSDESRVREAAERIRRINRPYSLTIGDLPTEKKADDATKNKMLGNVDVEKKSVKITKRLLPKHELLTKLSSAKGAVRNLFNGMTHPYVVEGQRLFIFDDKKIDFENWNQEQIEQEMAAQRTAFEAKINMAVAEFYIVAKEISDKWPDILAAAKEQLKEMFNLKDYIEQPEVVPRLYVDFGPEGVLEASTESRYMSPDLQKRDEARMRERFEAVVRLQEDAFLNTFQAAVEQALKSVQATDAGSQKYFKSTVFENLFATFVDFRNKCLRYGMLSGTRVEDEVNRCIKALDADNMKVDDLSHFIRKSETRRKTAIEELSKVAKALGEVSAERTKNRVIIRRVGGDSE